MNHIQTSMEYLQYLARGVFSNGLFKVFSSIVMTIFGFLFGFEIQLVLLALVVLVTFDFFTGIMAAYQTGKPIKSRDALNTAVKLGVYGVLVSSAHLTQSIISGFTLMDIGMVAFLSATEFISIMENAGKMGYYVPLKLLNQIKSWQRGELATNEVLIDTSVPKDPQ